MRRLNFIFIPPHIKCTNCGGCCGPVPISKKEYEEIKEYCLKNDIRPMKNIKFNSCPFRNDKKKKCDIYPVRPILCRIFGVTKGMECKNGNTYELNGFKYIAGDLEKDITGMDKLAKELKGIK